MKRILFFLSAISFALCLCAQTDQYRDEVDRFGHEVTASNVFSNKILEQVSTEGKNRSDVKSSFSYNDLFQLNDVVSTYYSPYYGKDLPFYTMTFEYESGVVDQFIYDIKIHLVNSSSMDNGTEDYYLKVNEYGFCSECYEIVCTPNAEYPDEKEEKFKRVYAYNDNSQLVYCSRYYYKYDITTFAEITYDDSGRLTHVKNTMPFILGGGAVVSDYDVKYTSEDIVVPIPNTYNIPVGFEGVINYDFLDLRIAGLLGKPTTCLPLEISGVTDPSHGLTFNRTFDWELDDNNTPFLVKIRTEEGRLTGQILDEDSTTFHWKEVSHIEDIDRDGDRYKSDQWYSIQGYPVETPQKGLYIVRRANGKLEKVIIR